MPRSTDGRWIASCRICGETFQQRRPDQLYCSLTCSNRAEKTRRTGPRTAGVELVCPVCGQSFVAKRSDKRACSRRCYAQLPDRQVAIKAADSRPERRQRQNEQRRGSERVRNYNREKQLERYGTTSEQHAEMLARQRGLCAICGNPPKPDGVRAASKLHVDHDHATGQLRELLCLNCNNGIGRFRDAPALLRAAADYIERHRLINADTG